VTRRTISKTVQSLPGPIWECGTPPPAGIAGCSSLHRGVLKGFSLNTTPGLLTTTPTSQTSNVFPYPGTTTSVSSNQNSNAIVWALDNSSFKTTTGTVLYAYDATNLATELYTRLHRSTRDNLGAAVKFAVPTVANGPTKPRANWIAGDFRRSRSARFHLPPDNPREAEPAS
jgi:hypothetical protein